ncbi:group 1 truncated hemoglobin [Halomonas sp. M5N1S17]|uniref:group I truncated hemoglobin n=1 Tax=Halomonas alkalisoli TaxID=2907158 RepID=UPI001F17FAFF|nr:group 1 truncated hemoglobin [Halomonas alkalisoli]MCE9663713.1 group 1 truncated hemoglobin [Halomonas alkalisoli]
MTTSITNRSQVLGAALALLILINANPVSADDPPLYERLGGLPAISLAVNNFVDDFIQDPVILANPAVEEKKTPEAAPYIKFQVTALVCEITGGPCQYTGLSLAEAHDGLNVSEQEWDRMVELFIDTLDSLEVPEGEKEELLGLLGPTKDDIVVTSAGESS